jgi:hypothetical protein
MRNWVSRFMPEGYTVNHSIWVNVACAGVAGVALAFGDYRTAACVGVVAVLA